MAKPKDRKPDGQADAVAAYNANRDAAAEATYREALGRWAARRQPVKAKMTVGEDGALSLGSTDGDPVGLAVRLSDTLGTGSTCFSLRQLDQLAMVVSPGNRDPSKALNSMLAAVDGFRPQNEAEAMLAVQMAATHEAAMGCLSRMAHAETTAALDSMQGAANKLMRTFALQLEALSKMRRGGEQTVRVEHVHVYAGGQAVVGHVEHSRGGRIENAGQPHAPNNAGALGFAVVEPLLCNDAQRAGMPSAGHEGQGAVPDARRRQGKRRANG